MGLKMQLRFDLKFYRYESFETEIERKYYYPECQSEFVSPTRLYIYIYMYIHRDDDIFFFLVYFFICLLKVNQPN